MEDGSGSWAGSGKERRLPNLRQEPSLPVSPPSVASVGHFDGRIKDDSTSVGDGRSSGRRTLEEGLSKDLGRPPSGRTSRKGPLDGYESGDRSGRGENPASQSEDDRQSERRTRRESRGRRERAGGEDVIEGRVNANNDRRPDSNSNNRRTALAREPSRSESLGDGREVEKRMDERKAGTSGMIGTETESERRAEQRRARENERSEEESTEQSVGRGSERRAERSAAEEEERRRRKEERRIKRAEKEARRAARAQRQTAESGKEKGQKRESSREKIRERIAEGLSASQSGRGWGTESRNERRENGGEEATSDRERSRERDNKTGSLSGVERMRSSETARRDDLNGSVSGQPVSGNGLRNGREVFDTGSSGVGNGVSNKTANGRLGRGMSIMNEIYEETDEGKGKPGLNHVIH